MLSGNYTGVIWKDDGGGVKGVKDDTVCYSYNMFTNSPEHIQGLHCAEQNWSGIRTLMTIPYLLFRISHAI